MLALIIGQAAIGVAQASTTVNVNPAGPVSRPQRVPVRQGLCLAPDGFVYKNIPAFNLKTGDTIAFDLGAQNNVDIQLQISVAATTMNGGDIPGAYTTLVNNTQLPVNPRGNTVMGDYELQFTAQAPFSFTGGGLIIRFSNPGGAYATDLQQDATLVNDANGTDSSGFFVERFFNDADGLPRYTSIDTQGIGGFRLTSSSTPQPHRRAGRARPRPRRSARRRRRRTAPPSPRSTARRSRSSPLRLVEAPHSNGLSEKEPARHRLRRFGPGVPKSVPAPGSSR